MISSTTVPDLSRDGERMKRTIKSSLLISGQKKIRIFGQKKIRISGQKKIRISGSITEVTFSKHLFRNVR